MTGIELIAAERKRQRFSTEWDDNHKDGELAKAAVCYAATENMREDFSLIRDVWPFTRAWWKPTPDNRIRELEKAGALIAAEIDRLLRVGGKVNET